MDQKVLSQLNSLRQERQAAIVIRDIKSGSTHLIETDHDLSGEIASSVNRAFLEGKSRMCEVDGGQVFLNTYLPPTRLVVIGAVHISQKLAEITASTGFDLEIIDPRTAFASPDRFTGSKLHADWPETVLAQNPLDPYCALIAVTHDPKIDDFAIEAALKAKCFYIGALGSRKTHAKRLERLAENGIVTSELDKIHAPIGLDIGAANPAEIAVAILAEVIGSFRRRGLT